MNNADFRTTFVKAVEGFDCQAVKQHLGWTDADLISTLIDVGFSAWESYQLHGGVGQAEDNGIECRTDGDYVELRYVMTSSKEFQSLPF